jgi:ElaB/YqjD/DUF883 family membrane-anchored ribosome-binding protein
MTKKRKDAARELNRRVQELAEKPTELTHAAYNRAEVALEQAERAVKDHRWPAVAVGAVVGTAIIVALVARLVPSARHLLDRIPRYPQAFTTAGSD